MDKTNAQAVKKNSANPQPQDDISVQKPQRDWAVRGEAGEEETTPPRKKSFLARLIPESKKGKIVFANAVAQVASMTVAPLLVLTVEKLSQKQVDQIKDYVGAIFAKHMDRIEPAIRRPWEASLAEESLKHWKNASNADRGQFLGEVVTNMGFQGTFNVGVTIATRMLLDRMLGINAGGRTVVASQMLDTAVAMGALIGMPAAFPTQTRDARLALRDWLEKKEGFKKWTGPNGPRQYALNTVNFGIPDMLGFTAGTLNMMRVVKEKEPQAANRLQR